MVSPSFLCLPRGNERQSDAGNRSFVCAAADTWLLRAAAYIRSVRTDCGRRVRSARTVQAAAGDPRIRPVPRTGGCATEERAIGTFPKVDRAVMPTLQRQQQEIAPDEKGRRQIRLEAQLANRQICFDGQVGQFTRKCIIVMRDAVCDDQILRHGDRRRVLRSGNPRSVRLFWRNIPRACS